METYNNQTSFCTLSYIKHLMLCWISCSILCCCTSNVDPLLPEIIGTWYGTRVYVNPASGTKYQYLTVSFNQDKTGKLEYEAPSHYSVAYFKYSISSNTIKCSGTWASTDGDVDEEFNMRFKISGERIIPEDRYNLFMLTKDNSVITDSNGNELVDNSNLLEGIWINTDGSTIVQFDLTNYKEWVLSSKNSKDYDSMIEGKYIYDAIRKTLSINNRTFEIIILNESELKLSYNNNLFSYKRGSYSDIPSKVNITGVLISAGIHGWHDKSKDKIFAFYSNGKVVYLQRSGIRIGSWTNNSTLCASGSFKVTGNNFICDFSEVSWEGGEYSEYSKIFPGWEYNKPCRKEFKIDIVYDDIISITFPDGQSYWFYKNDY